jgi:hypothetical protein
MSGGGLQAMNPLHANFAELFERHLCRHSQFGINVGHLLCVIVTYLSLCELVYLCVPAIWLLIGLAALYLVILAVNLPLRVSIVTFVFVGVLFAMFAVLPPLPFWAYLSAIVLSYKVQVWSHRYWARATDMTEFDKKYPKGFALFILLSVYELPILLNYLVFDPRGLTAPSSSGSLLCPDAEPPRQAQPVV